MREHSLMFDRYLEILMRRKWFFLLPLVASVGVILAASAFVPQVKSKDYQAHATMRLTLAGGVGGVPRLDAGEIQRITNTSIQLVKSRESLSQIIAALGLNTSPGSLGSRISIRPLPATELLEVQAKGSTPEAAMDLANAVANAWKTTNAAFYSSVNRPELANSFAVFEPAAQVKTVVHTTVVTRLSVGIALGLAAGIGLALISEYTDRTLNSVNDVVEAAPVPVLSSLPRLKRSFRLRRQTAQREWRELDSRRLGEMRLLTFKLALLARERGLRSILFTGIWPKAGTSSIAIGAASGLAGDEFEVVLVDANLRAPVLDRVFEAPKGQPGLTDVLVTTAHGDDFRVAIDKAIVHTDRPGLGILTSGTPMSDSWNALGSSEMRRLIAMYKRSYDETYDETPGLMIIDGPPLFASADALALASVVSGVVIVCAEGRTTADDLQRSLSQLDTIGANVLGLIYNRASAASGLPQDAPNLIVAGGGRLQLARAGLEREEARR
jgi:Mrp family chromosome partitioning ATPase